MFVEDPELHPQGLSHLPTQQSTEHFGSGRGDDAVYDWGMGQLNTRVVLAQRPVGTATADHFAIETEEVGDLAEGQARVRVEFVSVDAGTRTMLRGEGFHLQVGLGKVVHVGGVGRVVESKADGLSVGDAVRGPLGAQTLATLPAQYLEKIDAATAPISAYLGILGGSTGVTAWIGMREVAKPQPGDVFVVSAAAGAVGSIVGQIAKRDGAQVIGIAGGSRKTDYLTGTLGFDHAIDYKNENVAERLKAIAPNGVNVFFDNVGGPILDAVLDNLAMRARVVICGAVSQYDDMANVTGPSMYLRLAERQSTMVGFAYFHFPERIAEATAELTSWLAEGAIELNEEILDGIDRFPEALQFMFGGGNLGKLLVKIG
jgi:NADPH-dependent curcumin reductase CurA